MQWITKSHLHLDRTATAWLIRRFVDPEAELIYLEWDQGVPPEEEGAPIPFGFPGVRFSSHDEGGTAFAKVRRGHELDDPALERIELIVDSGVRQALGLEQVPGTSDEVRTLGAAFNLLGEGYGVAFDDEAHLDGATPLYDALYVLCNVRLLPAESLADLPAPMPERVGYLREAIDLA
jgi:hypothetical protein